MREAVDGLLKVISSQREDRGKNAKNGDEDYGT
jgi:hypothetical protein